MESDLPQVRLTGAPDFQELYDPLRRIAQKLLQKERSDSSLHATELVHQTLVHKLMDKRLPQADASHLLAVAVRAMKQTIIDRARRRLTRVRHKSIVASGYARSEPELSVMLRSQLAKFAKLDPRAARIIRQRIVERRTWEEIAASEQISVRSVRDDYHFAIEWLRNGFGLNKLGL